MSGDSEAGPRVLRRDGLHLIWDPRFGDVPELGLFEQGTTWQLGSAPEGGRGSARVLDTPAGRIVVRLSQRGGVIGRFVKRRYWFGGETRVRTFQEWRLLRELRDRGFPVPEPVAAFYQRRLPWHYECGLATREIADAASMASRLTTLDAESWMRIGKCVGRFAADGLWHVDLNAHNILLTASSEVFLIDFDRATSTTASRAGREMLSRLERSIRKIVADEQFPADGWAALKAACKARTGD